MPPSDGGGKARKWTLERTPTSYEAVDWPDEQHEGDVNGECFTAVEKEWADRQLKDALDVIARLHEFSDTPDYIYPKHTEAGKQARADAEALLRKHGRPPDDS